MDNKLPRLAIVLNPEKFSGVMTPDFTQGFYDNFAPYRGRVGKVIGEYLVVDRYKTPMVVLEFDDGKQFAFPTSTVTFLDSKPDDPQP